MSSGSQSGQARDAARASYRPKIDPRDACRLLLAARKPSCKRSPPIPRGAEPDRAAVADHRVVVEARDGISHAGQADAEDTDDEDSISPPSTPNSVTDPPAPLPHEGESVPSTSNGSSTSPWNPASDINKFTGRPASSKVVNGVFYPLKRPGYSDEETPDTSGPGQPSATSRRVLRSLGGSNSSTSNGRPSKESLEGVEARVKRAKLRHDTNSSSAPVALSPGSENFDAIFNAATSRRRALSRLGVSRRPNTQ
ncbi:hypothetical protein V8E36_000749 [Tilletia maclaganii]